MLELDHLTVSGDVTFGKNVSLKVCHYDETALQKQVLFSSPKFTFKNNSLSVPEVYRYIF